MPPPRVAPPTVAYDCQNQTPFKHVILTGKQPIGLNVACSRRLIMFEVASLTSILEPEIRSRISCAFCLHSEYQACLSHVPLFSTVRQPNLLLVVVPDSPRRDSRQVDHLQGPGGCVPPRRRTLHSRLDQLHGTWEKLMGIYRSDLDQTRPQSRSTTSDEIWLKVSRPSTRNPPDRNKEINFRQASHRPAGRRF